jgi:hypothetical protein
MPDNSRLKSSTAFSIRALACDSASLLVAAVLIGSTSMFLAAYSAREN